MSRKRKISDSYNDERDGKQRQRMTHFNLNNIFREQTTQEKLYDGMKSFFRKLKDSTRINESKSCCSCMHCTMIIQSICNYCEKQFCFNHLIQCSQCDKTYCPFCSTTITNELSICWTCMENK